MANGFGPKQTSRVSPDHSVATVQQQHAACEVVDFFRKLPGNHSIPVTLLGQARLAAIRMVASGVNSRLQHAFLLHTFCADVTLLNFINEALHAGELTNVLLSFMSTLLGALQELPLVKRDTAVFRLVPAHFEAETYSKGSILHWSGFTICLSHQSAIFSNDDDEGLCASQELSKASAKQMLFRIKARTGRSLSEVSASHSSREVVFMPGTCFKVIGHFASDKKALRRQEILQSANQSLENCQVVIVDLEEVSPLEDDVLN